MNDNFDLNLNKTEIEVNLGTNDIEIELPGGARGLKGDTGATGPKGDTGDKGDKGDTGDSGVWVGNEEPSDPDYNVWIDPDGGASTVPTKTSDLINDSGYITTEKIGYSERPTNKIFVDENNVEHIIYAKRMAIDFSDAVDVSISGAGTFKGIEHNITNFDRIVTANTYYQNYKIPGMGLIQPGYPYLNDTYLLFQSAEPTTKDVYLEYTKSS